MNLDSVNTTNAGANLINTFVILKKYATKIKLIEKCGTQVKRLTVPYG